MFATQHYMETGADHKKRARDQQADPDSPTASFGEHRNKRLQCLPLRTSPRASQQPLPADSITPLNSNSDEDVPRSHFSPWSSSPAVHSQPHEVDMMDTTTKQSHLDVAAPITGRMPTPIQPSFAAQVRGQNWTAQGPGATTMNGSGYVDANAVPRSMAGEADWQAVQNNRRLPSPISESEDSSPGMVLDGSQDHHQLSAQLQNSSLSAHSPHAMEHMEHPNAMHELEALHAAQAAEAADEDPNSPSPSRKGHSRNTHTVNTWTWQPGMKRSFSIGYRSDCEKCRLKVPGHFNHIIVS